MSWSCLYNFYECFCPCNTNIAGEVKLYGVFLEIEMITNFKDQPLQAQVFKVLWGWQDSVVLPFGYSETLFYSLSILWWWLGWEGYLWWMWSHHMVSLGSLQSHGCPCEVWLRRLLDLTLTAWTLEAEFSGTTFSLVLQQDGNVRIPRRHFRSWARSMWAL